MGVKSERGKSLTTEVHGVARRFKRGGMRARWRGYALYGVVRRHTTLDKFGGCLHGAYDLALPTDYGLFPQIGGYNFGDSADDKIFI